MDGVEKFSQRLKLGELISEANHESFTSTRGTPHTLTKLKGDGLYVIYSHDSSGIKKTFFAVSNSKTEIVFNGGSWYSSKLTIEYENGNIKITQEQWTTIIMHIYKLDFYSYIV